MDLAKAFACVSREILIAKLEAYGFGTESLKLLLSYLKGRHQRVRLGLSLSKWFDLIKKTTMMADG